MKNNLKELRAGKGLTQAELAESVHVSRQTIISIESGRYIPSVFLALKIAEVLRNNVHDIFELQKGDL